MTDVNAHRDTKLESLLVTHGFDVPKVELVDTSLIDFETSSVTQIRDLEFDPDLVDRYRHELVDGAVFPAGLLQRSGDRLVVVAGMHRARAHAAEGLAWPAYVTSISDVVAYQIAVADNTTHGEPLTTAERERHGMFAVNELGMAHVEAGRMAGISPEAVRRAIADVAGLGRADALSSAGYYERLDRNTRVRAASIDSDALFASILAHLVDHRVSQADASPLITAVKKRKDLADQLAFIDDDAQKRIKAGPRRKQNRENDHIPRLRTVAWSALEIKTSKLTVINAGRDREALATASRRAGLHLLEIAEHLTPVSHQCQHCGDRFETRVLLGQHRITFHPDEDEGA